MPRLDRKAADTANLSRSSNGRFLIPRISNCICHSSTVSKQVWPNNVRANSVADKIGNRGYQKIVIIIMVIVMCYFSGEHIALSINKKKQQQQRCLFPRLHIYVLSTGNNSVFKLLSHSMLPTFFIIEFEFQYYNIN